MSEPTQEQMDEAVGAELVSQETIDAATKVLRDADAPFLLIVGAYEHASTIESNLLPENQALFKGWIESGHLNGMVGDHLKHINGEHPEVPENLTYEQAVAIDPSIADRAVPAPDDDLNEPLGTPHCGLDGACEACQ